MNGDIAELLREGLDRLTEEARVPAGMAGRARAARHRKKIAARAVLACGTAVVTAAAVIAVTGPGRESGTGGVANARTTAYVVSRVENALAAENFVIEGRATGSIAVSVHGHRVSSSDGPYSSWTYGNRWRMEEFAGPERYWAQGTARIGGKLVRAYVTDYDHRYSVSPLGHFDVKPCSRTAQQVLGGPAVAMPNWPAFIKAMLGCQHATVTGHRRIGGVQTTVISGSIDIPLSKGYAGAIKAARLRVRYTLDVDSATYLPVRAYGSNETYGGVSGRTVSAYVTQVRWLPPTKANIAKALVTIPPGYQLWQGPQTSQ
jgi:hypothetical protein